MTSTDAPGTSPEAQRVRTNLEAVRRDIEAACRRVDRDPEDVRILPVTKHVDTDLVRLLHATGVRAVGESTVQETLRKREVLVDLDDLRWHLVGHLQRNKVRRALEHLSSVHSIDSLRLAEAVDRHLEAQPHNELRIFVQVNVSGEAAKYGMSPDKLVPFLERLAEGTSLQSRIAGLMTVAPLSKDVEETRPFFRQLRKLRDDSVQRGLLPAGAGLSMGMSRDLAVAIEEGATIVRVGSRLFDGLPSRRSRPNQDRERT